MFIYRNFYSLQEILNWCNILVIKHALTQPRRLFEDLLIERIYWKDLPLSLYVWQYCLQMATRLYRCCTISLGFGKFLYTNLAKLKTYIREEI